MSEGSKLSVAKAKTISQLKVKKFRALRQRFLVEGGKRVLELVESGWSIEDLVCTPRFLAEHPGVRWPTEPLVASEDQLSALGTLTTNRDALAVVKMPIHTDESLPEGWILLLDRVSDPGNLGALLRVADWYGVKAVVLSPGSVEWTNPKAIAASMGSFLRVKVVEVDLEGVIAQDPRTVYAALLEGNELGAVEPQSEGFLLMGSEAHGISPELLLGKVEHVTIPRRGAAESLNVAVAAGILCQGLIR